MFRRHVTTLVFVAAAALLVACSSAPLLAQQQAPENIILIGWDGCQRDHLKEMIARNEVPNLMALAAKGNLVAIDMTRTTDTKAGWAQILTGYEPEVTGVFSNSIFRPIPEGYTIFERLENFLGAENIYTAAVIGKKNHLGCAPPRAAPRQPQADRLPQRREQRPRLQRRPRLQYPARTRPGQRPAGGPIPGEPYYLTQRNMDLFENGLGADDNVGARALEVLDEYGRKRFFLFIHFAEPDHPGHAHGENSQEYTDSVKRDDEWLGRIAAKLEDLGVGDQTLIYVTSDHGFDEGQRSHRNAPYVFLATDDPLVMRRGMREDIAPTILWRFGVDLATIDPPLDGHPLTQPYQPPIW